MSLMTGRKGPFHLMDQEDLDMYQIPVNWSFSDLASLVADTSRKDSCEVFHLEDGACTNGNENA